MSLKWESFADESFKFKEISWYSTTTYALDIHVARPCLFLLLNFSMFVTVCYLNTAEIFLLEPKEGERAEELVPLLLFKPICPHLS